MIAEVPQAPQIVMHTVKAMKVSCPYCVMGYAEVIETIHGKEVKIEGIDQPRRCRTCNKYFRLMPKLQLVGEPMEDKIK